MPQSAFSISTGWAFSNEETERHERFEMVFRSGICKAGPQTGIFTPKFLFISYPLLVIPAVLTAIFTAAQEFRGPVFLLVNQDSFTEESTKYPWSAKTSAIQGAIYPAGARNHGRQYFPPNSFNRNVASAKA